MTNYKILKPFNSGLFTNLISGIAPRCDKIVSCKQVTEASNLGLEVICASNSANHNLYKYLKCGHSEYLQPSHVRRGHVRCTTCKMLDKITLVEKSGLKFLYTEDDKVVCAKPCGHVGKYTNQNLKMCKNIKCSECFSDTLLTTCAENDYTILSKKDKRSVVRFNKCGHQKEVANQSILRANIVCRVCEEDKYSRQAAVHGLVLMEKSADEKDAKRSYVLPCGHSKRIRLDHAAANSWSCEICGDTHYNRPSYIYLFRIEDKFDGYKWLKFGYSKNLEHRANTYGTVNCKIDLIDSVLLPTGRLAVQIEKGIHAKYKHARIHKNIMKKHMENGNTECYPIDFARPLLDELQKCKAEYDKEVNV